MAGIPYRASQRNKQLIPFGRPRIEREREAEGWLVLLPSGHGWLLGDRRQALAEFAELERVERGGGAMTLRRRLPQRRGAIAVDLEHAGHHFRMQIGCFPDGALGEVFLDAAKQNSALDAFAADAAILVSLLLQHGATPAEIGRGFDVAVELRS